jgi:hypothetical protein
MDFMLHGRDFRFDSPIPEPIEFRFRQQVRSEITIAFAGQVSRAPSFSSDGHARLTNIGSQYLGMFYNTVEMLIESDLPSR